MALTLVIVVGFTEAVLIARGAYAGAAVLGLLALPIFVFAVRRSARR